MTTTAIAISGRNDCLKGVIQPGDRVEFRQFGYNKEYATGKVLKVDSKGLLVRVDRAMRSARVALCDIVKVLNNA